MVKSIQRPVQTNPLKCALDQIASNRFEKIGIRSVHTSVTESKSIMNYENYIVQAVKIRRFISRFMQYRM